MRARLGIGLAAAAAAAWLGAAAPAGAATLTVTITGLADTDYELNVSGILKSGRLGAVPGPATVRDLVDVGGRDSVKAFVTFSGRRGVIATCPAVEVRLERAEAACEPNFVLTGRQTGADSFACEARCEPRKRSQKSSDEDDDDDWVYALNAPAPLQDGWALRARGETHSSQVFYSRAMSGRAEATLYSPPTQADQASR